MKQEKIINEIISNKELMDSPLLLTWIQESEENLNAFIAYKNSHALTQTGAEMSENDILEGLEAVRKATRKSRKYIFKHPFLKYAAILVLIILGGYYHLTSTQQTKQTAKNEITVAEGQRNLFTLPDGSKVMLVNNSKIIYPTKFSDKTREIHLEGEAYLTIAHNDKSPFIVHVENNQIEVLGTEFLVSAYPENESIQVDLITGKVKIDVDTSTILANQDSYLLNPNETFILNKTSGSITKFKMEDDFYKFWKEGEYRFKKETFASLALKLERIYHIDVLFEKENISSCEFTGAIYANSTINSILDIFQKASSVPFEYKIENREVYITFK